MTAEFVTYRKYSEKEPATALMDLFRERGIACELEEDSTALGAVFTGNNTAASFFRVKIQAQDFRHADMLLQTQASHDLSQVDPDHYLFAFTNEELLALLAVPDEWSEFDYQLASIILKDRGHEVSPETVDKLRQDRLRELARPDTKNRVWIVIGYLLAVMGGLLGIIIGWHLVTFKKTLPNGERVYDYSLRDREHGQRIRLLGIFMAVAITLWRIFALE
jgi:hypothetical protein